MNHIDFEGVYDNRTSSRDDGEMAVRLANLLKPLDAKFTLLDVARILGLAEDVKEKGWWDLLSLCRKEGIKLEGSSSDERQIYDAFTTIKLKELMKLKKVVEGKKVAQERIDKFYKFLLAILMPRYLRELSDLALQTAEDFESSMDEADKNGIDECFDDNLATTYSSDGAISISTSLGKTWDSLEEEWEEKLLPF